MVVQDDSVIAMYSYCEQWTRLLRCLSSPSWRSSCTMCTHTTWVVARRWQRRSRFSLRLRPLFLLCSHNHNHHNHNNYQLCNNQR